MADAPPLADPVGRISGDSSPLRPLSRTRSLRLLAPALVLPVAAFEAFRSE